MMSIHKNSCKINYINKLLDRFKKISTEDMGTPETKQLVDLLRLEDIITVEEVNWQEPSIYEDIKRVTIEDISSNLSYLSTSMKDTLIHKFNKISNKELPSYIDITYDNNRVSSMLKVINKQPLDISEKEYTDINNKLNMNHSVLKEKLEKVITKTFNKYGHIGVVPTYWKNVMDNIKHNLELMDNHFIYVVYPGIDDSTRGLIALNKSNRPTIQLSNFNNHINPTISVSKTGIYGYNKEDIFVSDTEYLPDMLSPEYINKDKSIIHTWLMNMDDNIKQYTKECNITKTLLEDRYNYLIAYANSIITHINNVSTEDFNKSVIGLEILSNYITACLTTIKYMAISINTIVRSNNKLYDIITK